MLTIGKFKGKVFVISLLHCDDRRKFITDEFAKAQLEFEFVDAVNGKDVPMRDNPDIDFDAVSKSSKWLTPGIMGASLSHLLCYKKIISENLDFGLIFEDDIMFKIKDIHKLVEQIVPITLPGNITLLYYQSWDKISFHKSKGKELSEKISAYQADDAYDLICAAGYLISKESCEEMIRILLPVHTGPDCWQYVFRKGAFKKLFLLYPIPCGTFNFRSTVTNLEMLDKGSLKSKIIAAIDDYKIPILYQYLKNRREKNKNNLQQIEVVDD